MIITPKRKNPLSITLNLEEEKYVLLKDNSEMPNYDLKIGCIIGTENYGFNIITPKEEISYYTQCPIHAIEIKNNLLIIYEEGKSIPWKFSLDGNCISEAKFYIFSEKDTDYIFKNFKKPINLLPQINKEAYSLIVSNVPKDLNFYSIDGDTLIIHSTIDHINRQLFYKNFKNNTTIKTIRLEDGIKAIDAGSFSDFLALKTLYIPESIENMALYIIDENIAYNLLVYYKKNDFPIDYNELINTFFKKNDFTIASIDKLYSFITLEGNILHIHKISSETIDALRIIYFNSITTIVIDCDLNQKDINLEYLNYFYDNIYDIGSVNKIVFMKNCSTIITTNGVEYEYNGKIFKYNKTKTIYPYLAESVTKEIVNLLNNENDFDLIYELVVDLLDKYDIYLEDEETCCKLLILGFIDVTKALIKNDSIARKKQNLTVEYIKEVFKILSGCKPLISKRSINEETIDLNEYKYYLALQRIFPKHFDSSFNLISKCNFSNSTINMPSLALFGSYSINDSTFDNVYFEGITPSSWQPTYVNNNLISSQKSFGSRITFKTNLYLELGRECNAICKFCMNRSFEPKAFYFDNIKQSLEFLIPYLDDIFIGGGEPTLKVEYLLKLKQIYNKITPTIISNGSGTLDLYQMLWDKGYNIGISRHAITDKDNKTVFGNNKILSSDNLCELINQQQRRKVTIFVTCMPGYIYSIESILNFIQIYHKLGCNIIFQSPMLDKTLGDLNKSDTGTNKCHQIFSEIGKILKNSNFSKSISIIGTAGYCLTIYEKSGLGTISFKEYISSKEYDELWPYAIKRTFDLSITPDGEIYENWNSKGKKLNLNFDKNTIPNYISKNIN